MACCLMTPSHYLINIDLSMVFCGIQLRLSLLQGLQKSTSHMVLAITLLKLQPYLPGANESIFEGQHRITCLMNLWFNWISSLTGERCYSMTSAGSWFNIKMSSYQYRKSHCGDKTVVRSSYLHSGISYTGKMASLYWISPQQSTTRMVVSGLW